MTTGRELLTRVEAWLAEPQDADTTAELLMDVAARLELHEQIAEGQSLPALSPQLLQALKVVRIYPGITAAELGSHLGLSGTHQNTLAYRLLKSGWVEKRGVRHTTPRGRPSPCLYPVTPSDNALPG